MGGRARCSGGASSSPAAAAPKWNGQPPPELCWLVLGRRLPRLRCTEAARCRGVRGSQNVNGKAYAAALSTKPNLLLTCNKGTARPVPGLHTPRRTHPAHPPAAARERRSLAALRRCCKPRWALAR